MSQRTKEEQSNAGIGSALQGGGRPKVKRINTSFDEILANTSPAIQHRRWQWNLPFQTEFMS